MLTSEIHNDLDTGGSVAKYIPALIPINSLSGGVGRQAPSKRMPNEATSLDNVYCSLEKSIERRLGTEMVLDKAGLPTRIGDATSNVWYDWFAVSENKKFLICVNRDAANRSELLKIFLLDETGSLEPVELNTDNIDADAHAYLTFGTEDLKRVAIGTSLLLLNTEVYAGFTSDHEDDFIYNLDGSKSEDVLDVVGKEAPYHTAATVDPENEGVIWNRWGTYISGDIVIDPSVQVPGMPDGTYYLWKLKEQSGTHGPLNTPPAEDTDDWEQLTNEDGSKRTTKFIPVKEYIYPDPTKPHLGQSVLNLSKLKLPPPEGDLDDNNGAEAVISKLYPDIGSSDGTGKVYYFAEKYATTTPGYYRVRAFEKAPYLHKIRTPDKMSLLDNKRMPMQLAYDAKADEWHLRKVDWDPRESGTIETNPGPSPFSEKGKAIQARIESISFYRDRLFLSSGDKLFSSRMSNWDNLWIDDPGTIVATDPIDLSVSSNKYSPITHTIPFNDFLFINTKGDTQFELIGSENQITPFTAEIAPTTFYSTLPSIEPQLMSSQIYFFGDSRLYIYFNSEAANINQAVPVSNHVPGYLPNNVEKVTTSPAHDTIFFTDADEKNIIYMYTNRFSGDQVVQNAFYRQVLPSGTEIRHIHVIRDSLYIVASLGDNIYVLNLPMRVELDLTDYRPRLDNSFITENAVYNDDEDVTIITVPYECSFLNRAVVTSDYNKRWIYEGNTDIVDGETQLYIPGRVHGNEFLVGSEYTTVIELSEQFIRDEKNNAQDGVLNLRSINLRHDKSGHYDVAVSRLNRLEEVTTFSLLNVDALNTELDMDTLSGDGELKVRILGLSNEVSVIIRSSYPEPLNITNMEFRGKFRQRDSLLEKR